jgi:hypothetical protein
LAIAGDIAWELSTGGSRKRSDTLIFCRKYTYQDVERLGGVIRIVRAVRVTAQRGRVCARRCTHSQVLGVELPVSVDSQTLGALIA